MPWLPSEHMADVHTIRQDYAQALAEWEADRDNRAAAAHLDEVDARRARAIRMIHEEDGASVRHLSAMFRCSKAVIRGALEGAD